jgi:hypothetical protein
MRTLRRAYHAAMKQPRHEYFMGAQFDRFLHEPIGEDTNGLVLTVLSALARLDVDPWEEAAALSRLPGVAAARKLALLLAKLPGRSGAFADAGSLAARLISLLPGSVPRAAATHAPPLAIGAAARFRPLGSLMFFILIMLLMFTGEWLMSRSRSRAPPATATSATTGAAAVPPDAPAARSAHP